MRQIFTTPAPQGRALTAFKAKVLHWLQGFTTFAYLDSNGYTQDVHQHYELLVGAGNWAELATDTGTAFEQWADWQAEHPDWQLGWLSYDLKNELENLSTQHLKWLEFPDLFFFVPTFVLSIRGGQLTLAIKHGDPAVLFEQIDQLTPLPDPAAAVPESIPLRAGFNRATYLEKVEQVKRHIAQGDVYELNLCQAFFANPTELDPFVVFQRLNRAAQSPFAAFFGHAQRYVISASPERFLQKKGQQLLTQPIKGTIRRGKTAAEDAALRAALAANPKDQSENVMIVDLVRNDLARSCVTGSIKVDELFGIYSFATVHHMISTISGQLRPEMGLVQAIRNAFPMGSMTGAPKVRCLKLIDTLESGRRGVYSGAIGYVDPAGDADLNVVIRSILFDASSAQLSLQVGSAIVADSDPEQEYAECLLKAAALFQALGAYIPNP